MWHEARRQERRLKGMMVDYSQRAERRKAYYDKIKLEPKQFLRIFGTNMKIHIDQTVYENAESTLVPWQNDPNLIIDRFDVRAHLDFIPDDQNSADDGILPSKEADEENKCNYERYRILVQNEFAGVNEEQCLKQIHIDEQYGNTKIKEEKKKPVEKKAAIAFTYEDSETVPAPVKGEKEEEFEDDDMDLDMEVDVEKLSKEQVEEMNKHAMKYGMIKNEYYQALLKDKQEAEEIRMAKLLEEEKAQFSGRKARKERRIYKEKRIRERGRLSPPSYAVRESPKRENSRRESSSSRSSSPGEERITFITSFGGDSSDGTKGVVHGPAIPRHLRKNHQIIAIKDIKDHDREVEAGNETEDFDDLHQVAHHNLNPHILQLDRVREEPDAIHLVQYLLTDRSKSSSKSKSPEVKVPIKKYRRKSLEESVSDSSSSSADEATTNSTVRYRTGQSIAMPGKSRSLNKKALSQRELLQKRMQAQLSKHYKADKRAEKERHEREEQERMDREDELRELSLMLRKRDRERRQEADLDRKVEVDQGDIDQDQGQLAGQEEHDIAPIRVHLDEDVRDLLDHRDRHQDPIDEQN
ncbi:DgyrCDS10594 [Dimorphilus gyrociliatus]|uniref:DgyrCDS10594 n=1 Tax=Dimorphilus gyrociliatus TaxID=2664684 RepID=A0A7I8W235_9ANNE|nr:DgyrCDS10594 [Dimorphilus gyrociliatus]